MCEIVSCPEPEDIANGTAHWHQHTYNSTAWYNCDEGFILKGLDKRTCEASGYWDTEAPVCNLVSCPAPPELINGNVLYSCLNWNCEVVFDCHVGHSISGVDVLTCLANGSWNFDYPYCKQIHCDVLPMYTNNGMIRFNNTAYGSKAEIVCDYGYETSDTVLECDDAGSWSYLFSTNETFNSDFLSCQPVVCPLPYTNNVTTITVTDSLKYKSIIYYNCSYGYRLVGPSERSCLGNRSWSGADSYCELITCPSVETSYPLSHVLENGTGELDTVISFSCGKGFYLNGSDVVKCTNQSTWSYPLPSCIEITCEEPDVLENGRVEYETLKYNSTVNYTCNEG